jgi:formylmethanofuran dehydrogenase subunit E
MSVSGLYDSEQGDKMARKTLVPYRKIADSEIDDEEPRLGGRPRRKCACGNALARPYIERRGVPVCVQCAEKTPRQLGGKRVKNKCTKCKQIAPRSSLVVRRGKLYCKSCAKEL